MDIRPERPGDEPGISAVHQAAFGGPAESTLVDRLRRDGVILVSLVAVEAEHILGHVLFCHLEIGCELRTVRAAALAPLAVLPGRQRQRIGSRLVTSGLARCRDLGIDVVIVVGDPGYYERFGFSAALATGLQSPFAGPYCMALELDPGCLSAGCSAVRYPEAFDLVG